jgi:drug/metabolite transporter (DMT)-like permease
VTTSTPPPLSPTAAEVVFRQALRDMLLLLGVLTVVGVVVGYLVDGTAGVWGALLGVFIALVFSGTTVISVLRTARSTPTTMMAVIMFAWLGKLVAVIALLAILKQFDFYNPAVLFLVSIAGVIGSAVLDARAVHHGRVPYVEG